MNNCRNLTEFSSELFVSELCNRGSLECEQIVHAYTEHLLKTALGSGFERTFGYKAPSHKWADAKLAWRSLKMSAGHAPEDSSPRIQEDLNLNKDSTFHPKKSASKMDDDEPHNA